MVSDEEILSAYRMVAALEGVFCEPASAASIAGVIKLNDKGFFKEDDSIVCTLTGHGLKDPDNAIKISEQPVTVDAEIGAVLKVLGFKINPTLTLVLFLRERRLFYSLPFKGGLGWGWGKEGIFR